MDLRDRISVFAGYAVLKISRILNLGAGGTWPGELALKISPAILTPFGQKVKKGIILIAGTNGKTTTSLLVKTILDKGGFKTIHNSSGANLLNGIASAFIDAAGFFAKFKPPDYAVFEVDEYSLPLVLTYIKPLAVICLNLFRDQLDRYGEVDTIAEKWQRALKKLPKTSTVILNADDPQIAYLGKNLQAKTVYFGLNQSKDFLKRMEHATDSIFCLSCRNRLFYDRIYYSHIGIWRCKNCGLKRPKPDYIKSLSILPGFYNQYNVLAAISLANEIKIPQKAIKNALSSFSPAFGRQEEFAVAGKKIKILLSKNPAGFNESLKTVIQLKAKDILLVLNDRIPDGRDVSWIWDVDFEKIRNNTFITVSGDRCFDLALRLNYADLDNFRIEENLRQAISKSLKNVKNARLLYILPTYTAMLEVRKIISGRKIL